LSTRHDDRSFPVPTMQVLDQFNVLLHLIKHYEHCKLTVITIHTHTVMYILIFIIITLNSSKHLQNYIYSFFGCWRTFLCYICNKKYQCSNDVQFLVWFP